MNIEPKKSIDIAEELKNLELYKYHPNGIITASLNRIKDIVDGKIEIVDPNNPFIYLLETNCLNTAFAIQEMTLLTRKLYPRLANNEDDLYLHMSDADYIGRFSEPAKAPVTFAILFTNFKNQAYREPNTSDYSVTIPKYYKIYVDKYIFTLMSSIVVKYAASGVIDIRYLNDGDGLLSPTSNHIRFDRIVNNTRQEYLNFSVDIPEIDIEYLELPIEKSKLFKGSMGFRSTRYFYAFRAFTLINGTWEEMLVTHTDQVYDINQSTCIVKVNQKENRVDYYIPPVYINTNKIGSKVKFLIYTTCGEIDVNFNEYLISDFKYEFNPVFPEIVESNPSAKYLNTIGKYMFLETKVYGGKGPKSFEELKAEVISNSIGDRLLPITSNQLEYELKQNRFNIIKNVDVVTDRTYLLETEIPEYSSRYSVSRLNMDIIELKTSLEKLKDISANNVEFVGTNNEIAMFHQGAIFNLIDGKLEILSTSEANSIRNLSGNALVTDVNTNTYLSLYYHYILNTEETVPYLRAYEISRPKVKTIDYVAFNDTARMGVNSLFNLVTKDNIPFDPNDPTCTPFRGYTLRVESVFREYDAQYDFSNVIPYLVYTDSNGERYFLEGHIHSIPLQDENPVLHFKMATNYYINSDNKMLFTNFVNDQNTEEDIYLNLTEDLHLVYISNDIPSTFIRTIYDDMFTGHFYGIGGVVSVERYTIEFGNWLQYLYSKLRSSIGEDEYELVTSEIYQVYSHHVYDDNNLIIHHAGEVVLDSNGDPVVKQEVGEILLDINGNPIYKSTQDLQRYMMFLLIDYAATVVQDSVTISYRVFLRDYITDRIIKDAINIQDILLERTTGYLTVPGTIGTVQVKYDNRIASIPCRQGFKFDLYVNPRIFEVEENRRNIERTLINELDTYLSSNTVLSKTAILTRISNKLSDFIETISMGKFTNLDAEYINILTPGSKLSIKKNISLAPEGYVLKEDVQVNFILLEDN